MNAWKWHVSGSSRTGGRPVEASRIVGARTAVTVLKRMTSSDTASIEAVSAMTNSLALRELWMPTSRSHCASSSQSWITVPSRSST